MTYLDIFRLLFFAIAFNVLKSVHTKTCPARLITDLHQKNCTDQATKDTAYYLDRSGCIPKCAIYPTGDQKNDCSADPNGCIAGYNCEGRCGPADALKVHSCQTDNDCKQYSARGKCGKYCILPTIEEDQVECMAYHSNVGDYIDKYWKAQKFKPECDDNGKWKPKQCKGGLQGRCLCYSAAGVRLFGQALYRESESMTCACSRKISDLESAGRNYVSLHCDSLGNYEKLQCDMEKGLCWCAEPLTGELRAPMVPVKAMKKLPCYLEESIGSQYLRQCESKKYATALITAKLKARGVVTVETDTLLCDSDGSYGAYTILSGIAYCTWRDNSKIQTWQANLAGLTEKLSCNCARDFYMYQHSQSCEGNGNYVILQTVTNAQGVKKYYCVDDSGFAKTGMLDDPTTNCTNYY